MNGPETGGVETLSSGRRIGIVILRVVSGLVGLSLFPVIRFFVRAMVSGANLVNVGWLLGASTVSALFLWLAFRGHIGRDRVLIRKAWAWGVAAAAAGFLLGYFVFPPLYSAVTGKTSELGPLVGLFITGPAGFSAGVLIGLILGIRQFKKG
jgi:hypothetical protein